MAQLCSDGKIGIVHLLFGGMDFSSFRTWEEAAEYTIAKSFSAHFREADAVATRLHNVIAAIHADYREEKEGEEDA